jgi:putative membrane-bound dehydrogenase-like protein
MRVALFLTLLTVMPLQAGGLTPAEAVAKMQLAPGFSARCVASEPMIRQPLSISFDEKGRLWVLQYLQYPNPEGMKPLKQDQYLRTQWDKLPEPPPKGPKGADRITICYEPDEHGVFKKSKDFISGLNLAHGFCIGNGGVYVVQPPYLLFYADKNKDDIPDGDPEVLLTGFGLNDTHSMANSLQWGPDGWLYGAAGSTSTSRIKDPAGRAKEPIEFQQGIWRYHPKTKVFELFSEGGGNTYGLDFDKNGQCIAGTNWGGFAMLHHFPGAYYVKGFSKHGPLHNPYAYGYFEHVPYKNFKGGHVTCGGVLYEADAYPKEFRGQYIAGNLLSNAVYTHKMTAKGASFTAEHGTDLLIANDPWFRPVDLLLGPDGCIYVADWYDQRAAHLDPIDNWDKTNGRIYRIEYNGGPKYPTFDLNKQSNAELVELLKHENMWWRKEARRILSERPADEEITATIRSHLHDGPPHYRLESLWTRHAQGTLTAEDIVHNLRHNDANVRAWAIRLAENLTIPEEREKLLSEFGRRVDGEPEPQVLVQMAATAKNAHSKQGEYLLRSLYMKRPMPDDKALPLMLWWAWESYWDRWPEGDSNLSWLTTVADGNPTQEFVLERIVRKCMETNQPRTPELLGAPALRPSGYLAALRGIELGLSSSTPPQLQSKLKGELLALKNLSSGHAVYERLLVRLGDVSTTKKFFDQLRNEKITAQARIEALKLLAMVKSPQLQELLPGLLTTTKSDGLLIAVLGTIQSSESPMVPVQILANYLGWSASAKKAAIQTLLSRPSWAMKLFQTYDAGKLPKTDLTMDHAKIAVQLNDKALTQLVEKHFGKIAPATAGEKQARIAALNLMMSRSPVGDATRGKDVFIKQCIECHQLHGEGGKLGPDLTSADRKNRGYMLANIVDPSGYIRNEYVNHKINTHDGRTFTGIVSKADGQAVTLVNLLDKKEIRTTINKPDIETLEPLSVSLMPEKLLDNLSEAEIRDLFAYLASDPKPANNASEKKLKIGLVSGSVEYKSDETLPILQKHLEQLGYDCVRFFRKADNDIPGLEKLGECDAVFFFTRRLTIDGEQLAAVKKYVDSGKPVLGIRTASHGFQKWLEMDALVFGGNYKNHYKDGPKCEVTLVEMNKTHPVLNSVKPFTSVGSLYRNQGHAKDITVLMNGAIPGQSEPITWVRERKLADGKTQRVFYTSLGHPQDFQEQAFLKLLGNALKWSLSQPGS